MVNSGRFDGMAAPGEAFEAVVAWLGERGAARKKVNFKLRDWLISRQRYWGAPIPIVHCDDVRARAGARSTSCRCCCPTSRTSIRPTTGARRWPATRSACTPPARGAAVPARRETDTMDTFACSSWYHFRFASPHDETAAFDRDKAEYWLPVDLYVGGAEHAVMHLLYARFFCKVAQDAGYVSFGEPYARLRNQGMIQAEDGQKMSKSKGNVVTPDSVVEQYGADALRVYELFIAPFEQSVAWSDRGVQGCYRFLGRFWNLVAEVAGGAGQRGGGGRGRGREGPPGAAHAATRPSARSRTTSTRFRFNTAVSALMELQNELLEVWAGARGALTLAQWRERGHRHDPAAWRRWRRTSAKRCGSCSGTATTVLDAAWPAWDEELAADEVVTVVVQVNGKLRDRLEVPVDAEKDGVLAQARAAANTARFLEGKQVVKEIYVPGKLVNFVVR